MAQVSITIRGRQYQIACDDGQEAHIARLGRYLDQRAEQLATTAGSINDSLLLVMVGLVVADELTDTLAELENANASNALAARASLDTETAAAINNVAERIERIAARVEGT